MKRKKYKSIKPPLQVADFMCRHCRVQATRDDDRICGICKAVGKSAEPQKAARREDSLAARLAEPITHWFMAHHLIVPNDALIPPTDEKKAEKKSNGILNLQA